MEWECKEWNGNARNGMGMQGMEAYIYALHTCMQCMHTYIHTYTTYIHKCIKFYKELLLAYK